MAVARLAPPLWLVAGCVCLAALWPLTAYVFHPVVMPVMVATLVTGVVVAQRPAYGIALSLALAPLTNLEFSMGGLGTVQILRIALPLMAVGLLAYSLILSRGESAKQPIPVSFAVLFFVGVAVASSLQALDPEESVTKLAVLVTAATLFFVVLWVCRESRDLRIVVYGAVFGLLIAGAHGLLQYWFGTFSEAGFVAEGQLVQRIQGSFGHPNQFAGFLVPLLPLAVALVVMRRTRAWTRWLGAVALTLGLVALTLSYTRSAFLGLGLGTLLWLAAVRPRLAGLVAVLAVAATLLLAPPVLKERLSDSSGGALRTDLWTSAVEIFAQYPLLGAGLNNFAEGYRALPSTVSNASQRRLLHEKQVLTPPHANNLYLNVLAEEGAVGLLALLALAAAGIGTVLRGSRISDGFGRSVCLALGAGLATLGFHNLLDVSLIGEPALVMFPLLAVAVRYTALSYDPDQEKSGLRSV